MRSEFVFCIRSQSCDVVIVLQRCDVHEEGAVQEEHDVVVVGVGGVDPGEVDVGRSVGDVCQVCNVSWRNGVFIKIH